MFKSFRICVFSRRTTSSYLANPGERVGIWEDLTTQHRSGDRFKDLFLADNYATMGSISIREALDYIPHNFKNSFLEEAGHDLDDRLYIVSFGGKPIDTTIFKTFEPYETMTAPHFENIWVNGCYAILFGG
jgi:hypothetical protein